MQETINAPAHTSPELTSFWGRYFREIPVCSCTACSDVAVQVDPYFPYLDDLNRCEWHRSGPEGGALS